MSFSQRELFSEGHLEPTLDALRKKLVHEVDSAEKNYATNVDEDEWVAYLVSKLRVEPFRLHNDRREFEDLGERKVDVRNTPGRLIRDPSRPALVDGYAVRLNVPFDGEPDLLQLNPNLFGGTMPVAGVEGSLVYTEYQWPTDVPRPDLDGMADRLGERIETFLTKANDLVETFNSELDPLARQAIQRRRERLRETQSQLSTLRTPIRRRGDAPTTYAPPGIQRRPAPVPPSTATTVSEPVLIDAFYEHIVTVVRAWGRAIERTPAPYREAEEETLRDALLPMLNSHYEGGATGETFNLNGKIDVLIRVEDRTVFIGECKWWSGPKALGEALDQLFSYATWRDTKLALLFFVKNKDITGVIEKTRELLGAGERFIAWADAGGDHDLRCLMKWPGDTGITATLHVFFFHLPQTP
jgi:hypothetical protein